MKRWLLLFCFYDPDNYTGHVNRTFAAPDLKAAKIEAKKILDDTFYRRLYEFRLIEIGGHDSGSRQWDRRAEPNQLEVDYTNENYWNKDDDDAG